MKIVIAAEIFPPDSGGPATYSRQLAEALLARGWDVSLVCYSDKKHAADPTYVHRVLRSKFKLFHYVNYYRTLKRLAVNSDLIYAQGPIASGRPALRVAKELGKKLVVKVVGDYAWERARNSGVTSMLLDDFQGKRFGGRVGMLQKLERSVCLGASRVIVPSNYLKKIVSGWGVPAEKITVIYNALENPVVDTMVSHDPSLIVSVARLVPWKGLDTLVTAVHELNQEGHGFRLVIAGDGPEAGRLNDLIRHLSVPAKIKKLSHDEVMDLLSHAGVFVLNSAYEGLSHVILEAMASHLPVIASNIGGNPELVRNGENGLLIEYNNKEQLKAAIRQVHEHPELRQKFIDASHGMMGQFKFETMIGNTEKLLQRV